jgi:RNA polymerase nonessential primary-like sigma factor
MSSFNAAGTAAAFKYYLHDVNQHPLLSVDEERQLTLAMRQGDVSARDRLIASNLRLVIHIAKRYQRSYGYKSSLSLDDMVSEGNLGLLRAASKFDPSMGFRFSTYATHWIHEAIRRGMMNKCRLVRLPVHIAKRLNVYLSAQKRLNQTHYRSATAEDIAKQTGDSTPCVRELLVWDQSPCSLQTPSEDGQSQWQDNLVDATGLTPEETIARDDLLFHLQRFIAQLKPREQYILIARFGMGNRREESTLDAIAAELGVTRERVRQIQLHFQRQLKVWLEEAGYDASCSNDVGDSH